MFGKNKEDEQVKPQEEVLKNPQIGNSPQATTSSNTGTLSAQDRAAIDKAKNALAEAKEHQKIFGKFFQLDIGEESIVTIIPSLFDTFKTKSKDGELVDTFRYHLVDVRAPDKQKSWDVYASVAAQITERLDKGVLTMKIVCGKSQTGGRKYSVEDAQ